MALMVPTMHLMVPAPDGPHWWPWWSPPCTWWSLHLMVPT